jgi:hypothetical protein
MFQGSTYTELINGMLSNVADFLLGHSIENTDALSIQDWRKSTEASWSILSDNFLTKDEQAYCTSILATFLDAYAELASQVELKKQATCQGWSLSDRRASLQRLLNAPQIEQRTEAWYLDAMGLLSASQFNCILKPGRTRGQIVLQKASLEPPDTSQRKTTVSTDYLNAFTWGIRFEPVIKQIYQDLTNTVVGELGRLKHPIDRRLAASPDGIVLEGPDNRLSRFVEFKAPVSRKLLSIIPEDYMAQMQIQMEVGGVEECDYLEIKFNSKYGAKEAVEKDGSEKYFGNIYLIGSIETNEPLRYIYSPLNDLDWVPATTETEHILETIPWWTSEWYLTTVGRSRAWFASVQPAIESFWEDVDKAKRGEFELPPSTRKAKDPVCLIMNEE